MSIVLQILIGILVMVIEEPFFCRSHDDTQEFVEAVLHRIRAVEYCEPGILPVIIVPGLASILG